MGLSLAVFGCQKLKKCTNSKDKKNPRYPALRSSALSTELILPGAVSLSRGVGHLLYWACTRLWGLSGMEVKQRSKDEKRMIWKRSPGIFVKFVKSWTFTDDEPYLFAYIGIVWHFSSMNPKFLQYILGTWQKTMLVDKTVYDFFSAEFEWKSGGKRFLFQSTHVATVMSA